VAECAGCAATRAARVEALIEAAAALSGLPPCAHDPSTPPFPPMCVDCRETGRPVNVAALRGQHAALCSCAVWLWDAHGAGWRQVSFDPALAIVAAAPGS
jgi:hypothetical protein